MKRGRLSAIVLVLAVGPALAQSAPDCSDLAPELRQIVESLVTMQESTEQLLITVGSQIADLERKIEAGEDVSRSYALLDDTIDLQENLTTQISKSQALIDDTCAASAD